MFCLPRTSRKTCKIYALLSCLLSLYEKNQRVSVFSRSKHLKFRYCAVSSWRLRRVPNMCMFSQVAASCNELTNFLIVLLPNRRGSDPLSFPAGTLLASMSAHSFPLIPTFLAIQLNIVEPSAVFLLESCFSLCIHTILWTISVRARVK